jgi:transposase InsO family protein
MPGPVKGQFFYLYMILDIFSRKIVGWEVFERETAENASALIQKTVWAEGCVNQPLVLHADNGSPPLTHVNMRCRAAHEGRYHESNAGKSGHSRVLQPATCVK